MKTRSLLALALLALVLPSCGTGGAGGLREFNLVSLEVEWQLGQQLAAQIDQQYRLSNDPQVNAYIDSVGRRLLGQTNMNNLPWQFHVVQDPAINAFNIPGGHVYVHTGLIAAASNASELAGVMAHEIAHGVKRHGTEQMSKQYGLEMLASLALGRNPGQLQQLAAQIAGTGVLARFSREHEAEADEMAVQMMAAAGYDPQGMVTMFEKLLAERRSRPSRVEQFFATHPLTEDRIRATSNQIERMGARGGRTDEPEFQAIRARVQ